MRATAHLSQSEPSLRAGLARLASAGFEAQVHVDGERARIGAGALRPPEQLSVLEVVRAEGDSDPDHSALVLGVVDEVTGARGTLVVPFGASATDAALFAPGADRAGRLSAAGRPSGRPVARRKRPPLCYVNTMDALATADASSSTALTGPVIPPPWVLEGRGIILGLRPRPEDGARWPALLMFVDYDRSTAGPYGELLYIPGAVPGIDGRHHQRITRILVSTPESAVGGRANWGTPKDLATFTYDWPSSGQRTTRAAVSDDGGPLCSIVLRDRRLLPPLPVTTALLLPALRRFEQHLDGQQFQFTPSAGGWVKMAAVEELVVDDRFVPGLSRSSVFVGVTVPKFKMTFPASSLIAPLPEG